MVTRSEMVERWLQYYATKTDRHDIFLAGIGLLNDGDNAQLCHSRGLIHYYKPHMQRQMGQRIIPRGRVVSSR